MYMVPLRLPVDDEAENCALISPALRMVVDVLSKMALALFDCAVANIEINIIANKMRCLFIIVIIFFVVFALMVG